MKASQKLTKERSKDRTRKRKRERKINSTKERDSENGG